MTRLYLLWNLRVQQGNISWMAISGFVVAALMLGGGGFLLSKTLDDRSVGMHMVQASQPMAWETVMKWLSFRLHHANQQ